MHFNNQVLKVGTFDGILFSFFLQFFAFCSVLGGSVFYAGDNRPQATLKPPKPPTFSHWGRGTGCN